MQTTYSAGFRIRKEATRQDIIEILPLLFKETVKRFLSAEKKNNVVMNWRTMRTRTNEDAGDMVYVMEMDISEGKVPDPLEYSHKR